MAPLIRIEIRFSKIPSFITFMLSQSRYWVIVSGHSILSKWVLRRRSPHSSTLVPFLDMLEEVKWKTIAGIRKFRQFCVWSVLFKWEKANYVLEVYAPYEPKSVSVQWRDRWFLEVPKYTSVSVSVSLDVPYLYCSLLVQSQQDPGTARVSLTILRIY